MSRVADDRALSPDFEPFMCGLAGFLVPNGRSGALDAIARDMAETLAHRGPDDAGVWTDEAAGIALAHRRLSVVDLSPAGHQPMRSKSGRFVIVFNGEIYNHRDLRARVEAEGRAPAWRGHSDTEVFLEAISAWGVRRALEASVGMFALALWDCAERTLTLARDRLGEKPLYYGWAGETLLFASELKALRRHPAWSGEIDRAALALLLRHNNVPAPYSIYRGIKKLEPASYLVFGPARREGTAHVYWDAARLALAAEQDPFHGTPEEAVDELESLLRQSIGGQMLADVPLGAFLSGGVDSSTVVALMQAMSPRPVKTFSIGFEEAGYDEARHAKRVARHLGTDHTELYVTMREAMAVIPRLSGIYCEPFADSSQIPTCLVAELARRHVTVSLSGDGGDELFSGYTRYLLADRLWPALAIVPAAVRRGAASLLTRMTAAEWNAAARFPLAVLPRRLRPALPGDKLHKAAQVVALESPGDVYRALISQWQGPNDIVIGGKEPERASASRAGMAPASSPVRRMMLEDLVGYLPDDILVKVDRAAMAVSLESRVPLLDHRLVEFSWRLPMEIVRRRGRSKWPLRQVLYRYVPQALIERPKMGFGVPIDTWLRGPLRDWAESLLGEARLEREGFFNPGPIRRAWAEHLAGHRNLQHQLWTVLMFEAWLETLAPATARHEALSSAGPAAAR